MAEPARGEDGGRPGRPDGAARPDPRKHIWADVPGVIITSAHAARLAVAELAARPGDAAALEMAARTLEAFERAVAIGRQWRVDEACLAEERAAGYRECQEAYEARRCRLAVVGGGQAPR